jgi:hypothetical protein
MHTKFLEQNRTLLVSAMAALEMPGDPEARSWAGKLGFIEDDTRQFELRDLDGGLAQDIVEWGASSTLNRTIRFWVCRKRHARRRAGQIVRFVRPSILFYDEQAIDLYHWICALYRMA